MPHVAVPLIVRAACVEGTVAFLTSLSGIGEAGPFSFSIHSVAIFFLPIFQFNPSYYLFIIMHLNVVS